MSIELFSADLDGTLLGMPESTQRFNFAWASLPQSERPLLCYNSGRLVDDILKVIKGESLPWPDYIIGGVGTQIYDCRINQPVFEFDDHFQAAHWDLAKVEQILAAFPGVTRQPSEFLHHYKSSWYLPHAPGKAITAIRKQLAEAGLDVSLIYSSERDLDVLPANTSKGDALRWLCSRIGVPLNRVLVAGDTGNDSSMFSLSETLGIVVGNAQPELQEAVAHLPIYSATRAFADGVLEGLAYFQVILQSPRSERAVTRLKPDLRA